MRISKWGKGLSVLAVGAAVALIAGRTPTSASAPVTGVLGELTVPGFDVPTLSDAAFEKLHRAAAAGKERWAEIPWETDLVAARARSARESKPLLMWIMDGHPLGCT